MTVPDNRERRIVRERQWIVAPNRYEAWKWFSQNQDPEIDYVLVWTAARAEGARMTRDNVIFVDKENIDERLLEKVRNNILACSYNAKPLVDIVKVKRLLLIGYVPVNSRSYLILNFQTGRYLEGWLMSHEKHPDQEFFRYW